VTIRNTDVGALINAGQSPGSALFHVADTHRLRVYVSVPQAYAVAIHEGLEAALAFTEHPERRYTAAVTSTARALDANSRTLQVELQLDNAAGELLPGSYAQVYFSLPGSASALRVPANTILFRAAGLEVATLAPNGRVHLKSIQQGRDFGTEIEVLSGISPTDTLVMNPPDSISEGSEVRLVASP
jgi:RND family efflux transporter MFP subunit